MIEIDGSKFEGGGQILRTSCSLSQATKQACHLFNIRKGRIRPGLARQHILGLRALQKLCQGKLEGDQLGSNEVWFYPGEILARDIEIKIETASSITLILHGLILSCLQTSNPFTISFRGGATDTFFSPTIDYFCYVFLKILEKIIGKKVIELEIKKRGFYPEGGAEVEVKILPALLKNFNLTERGKLNKVTIISGASELLKQKRVAERQSSSAKEVLRKLNLPFEEKLKYYKSTGAGSQINIIGEFENTIIGIDNLGKLGKSAENVGKETGENFFNEGKSSSALDKHLADQILPFMALSPGKSKVTLPEITPHCQANIWVIEKFLKGKFEIKDKLISWNPKNLDY